MNIINVENSLIGLQFRGAEERQAVLSLVTQAALQRFPQATPSEKSLADYARELKPKISRALSLGFPFSLLSRSPATFASYLGSPLSLSTLYLTSPIQKSEAELETFLGNITIDAVAEIIFDLANNMVIAPDPKEGALLLWLLQKKAGCDFTIPDPVDRQAIETVMHSLLTHTDRISRVSAFLEILIYRKGKGSLPTYQILFSNPEQLLSFAFTQLKNCTPNDWPNKRGFLATRLPIFSTEEKRQLAVYLEASGDDETQKVGEAVRKALNSRGFNESLPHYLTLRELLPDLNISAAFELDFREITRLSTHPKIFLLPFSKCDPILVCGDKIVGTYERIDRTGAAAKTLMAYDLSSHRPLWGIPYSDESDSFALIASTSQIAIHFPERNHLTFLNSTSGEGELTISWEADSRDLYITREGVIYQPIFQERVRLLKRLIGGLSTRHPAPQGTFLPLDTHVGFLSEDVGLSFFSAIGSPATINRCSSAKASRGNLYTVEPVKSRHCIIKRAFSSLSISSVIALPFQATLMAISEEGIVILRRDSQRLFVNPHLRTILIVDLREVPHAETVDEKTGDLWWISETSKVYRISPQGTTETVGEIPPTQVNFMTVQQGSLYIARN